MNGWMARTCRLRYGRNGPQTARLSTVTRRQNHFCFFLLLLFFFFFFFLLLLFFFFFFFFSSSFFFLFFSSLFFSFFPPVFAGCGPGHAGSASATDTDGLRWNHEVRRLLLSVFSKRNAAVNPFWHHVTFACRQSVSE